MATAADVRATGREFATLDDASIAPFLADATGEVNPTAWGDLADRAITLLACHELAAAYPELYLGNAVQSDKAGDVSTTYATPALTGDLATSRFGLTYRRLLARICLTPEVI